MFSLDGAFLWSIKKALEEKALAVNQRSFGDDCWIGAAAWLSADV